jgi:hypothetical protein
MFLDSHSINGTIVLIVGTSRRPSHPTTARTTPIRNGPYDRFDITGQLRWHARGFGFDAVTKGYGTIVALALPHWFVSIVAGVLPGWWVWRRRTATGGRGFAVESTGEEDLNRR